MSDIDAGGPQKTPRLGSCPLLSMCLDCNGKCRRKNSGGIFHWWFGRECHTEFGLYGPAGHRQTSAVVAAAEGLPYETVANRPAPIVPGFIPEYPNLVPALKDELSAIASESDQREREIRFAPIIDLRARRDSSSRYSSSCTRSRRRGRRSVGGACWRSRRYPQSGSLPGSRHAGR